MIHALKPQVKTGLTGRDTPILTDDGLLIRAWHLISGMQISALFDRRPLTRESGPLHTSNRKGLPKCQSTRIAQVVSLGPAAAIALDGRARARAELEIAPGRGLMYDSVIIYSVKKIPTGNLLSLFA